ncbi:MAG TPA: hypothetical protein VEV84_10815 [Pyrinomonadaceae bacterium]|nr:hypothetical protein [Pyrinomonadaceae bacterium]
MNTILRVAVPLAFCILHCAAQVPITAKPANFKEWTYSPNSVFGISRLANVEHRPYCKVWKSDVATAKIQQYNAFGTLLNTTTVRFVNGIISQIATTNRWGDTYYTTKFAPAGPEQFKVTSIQSGENALFPAKSARYIFKNKLLTEIQYLSYDGNPIKDENGVATIRYKRFVDPIRYSLIQEMTFYDESEQPVLSHSWDAHKVVYERDERGNRTSEAYFGVDGEPLVNRFGGFKMRGKYNEADELISSTYVGLNDEAANNAYGISTSVYEYDKGLLTKLIRSDFAGHIVRAAAALDGIAIVRYEYDDNGNERRRAFFDELDKPMNTPAGYQSITYKYSPNGMLLRTEYFDKAGQPAVDRSGIHRYDYERDDKGRLTQLAYFDKQDQPMQDKNNEVFMVKYKYDELGRRYSESYWKDANTKMNRWNGYHETVSRYNDDGQKVEELTFDENGKLFVAKNGFSRVVSVYDQFGRMSELSYFNDQIPSVMVDSFITKLHTVRFAYDKNGRLSEISYFDAQNKPVNAEASLEENAISVHRVQLMYQGNRVVEELLYSVGSDVPSMKIDCLKHDYIGSNGVSIGRKDQ